MKDFKKRYLVSFRVVILMFFGFGFYQISAQCPANYTGNTTVSGNCTISSNTTVGGNLTINGATLTVNSGVTLTINGNLTVRAGGTLNGTGATFNITGNLAETNGTLNTINGGIYNIGGNVSTGSGGSFSLSNAQFNLSPGGTYTFGNGDANVISNTTITGVTTWTSNIGFTGTPAYGVVVTNSNITVSGEMSWHHANTSNSTFNIGGKLDIKSGNSYFSNCTINTGTSNVGTSGIDALTFNGGGILTLVNNTQMNVRGDVTNNEWYIDDSDVVITGDFDNAGSEILEVRNNGTITINGDFDNSGSGSVSADNGGYVAVDGDFKNTGGGSTDVDGGTFVVGGTYEGTPPTGETGSCSGGSGGCCGVGCGTLPVELVAYSVVFESDEVKLIWKTASEIDNDFFTLEKSNDGKDFIAIAKIDGNGTTTDANTYNWNVKNLADELVYFRLSQTDFDGTTKMLGMRVIVPQKGGGDLLKSMSFYPNPAQRDGLITFSGIVPESVEIYNSLGQLVQGEILNSDQFRLTEELKAGTYYLKAYLNGVSVGRRLLLK